MTTRRAFLKKLLAVGAGAACCEGAFASSKPSLAYAQSSGGSGNTLVMLNQFGGCDPLNSFAIPYNLAEYYARRPTIAIPQSMVLPIANGQLGFHPALPTLKRIFDEGDCAIIRGLGDPVGTRSHFTSQDIFSRGSTDAAAQETGWLGRLGDLYFEDIRFNTMGIGVGSQLDFTSRRETNIPLVIQRLENFKYNYAAIAGLSWNGENQLRIDTLNRLTAISGTSDSPMQERVDRAQAVTQEAIGYVQGAFEAFTPRGTYSDNSAGNYLKEVATTMSHGFGTKVYYGGVGGWDNHSDQGGVEGTQASLLSQIDSAVAAFEADAKFRGWWDRVAICIFTEFGRNTFENGSGGTDHGWGSAMLVIGGGVRGGLFGPEVTASDFQDDWLAQHIDFRNPFSEMISWLGYDPAPVFPENHVRTSLGLFT